MMKNIRGRIHGKIPGSVLCAALLCLSSVLPAGADIDGHGPDAWQVTGVAADDVLNGRMGPGVDYDIITHFAPGERGLIEVACVPLVPIALYMEMTDAQHAALPSRWCLMRSADLARAGWVAARYLQPDGLEPVAPVAPAAPVTVTDMPVETNTGGSGEIRRVDVPAAGLSYGLPPGWGADEPWFYETAAGARASQPTVTFYVNDQGSWRPILWLNMRQFQGAGCIEIAAGGLCYADAQDRGAAEYLAPMIAFYPERMQAP